MRKGTDIRTGPPGKAPTQRLADRWDPELELVEENRPVTEVTSRGKAPTQRLWDQLTNREKKELGVSGRDADGYTCGGLGGKGEGVDLTDALCVHSCFLPEKSV
jgi:hypothetical protein